MKNKKGLMFLASIMILIFHLWIFVFDRTNIMFKYETFIRSICYIGVDIFFLISAYSISSKRIDDYKKFIISRFKKVYLLFVMFAIIQFFYKGWKLETLLYTITGINLFIKGGGSFLWFVPAIMIMYILLPLYERLEDKYRLKVTIPTILIWIISSILLSEYADINQLFIVINRIPIILIGYYLSKYKLLDKITNKTIVGIITSIIGLVILYANQTIRLSIIVDTFYILAIPLTLGLVILIGDTKPNKITDELGSCTLELYAIQMIFGFNIAEKIYILINNKLLSNLVTLILVIMISYIVHKLIEFITKGVKKWTKKN